MKKFFRKIVSFCRFIKNKTINIIKTIRFSFKRTFAYFFLKRRQKSFAMQKRSTVEEFDDFYPDKGNLSEFSGFVNLSPTLDLSIIVPTFNVENYIADCLDSILSQQTNYSYEVIVIEDGSTDNTLSEINKFLPNDKIKLIVQENKGQSYSRNRAISLSQGRYLMMVDADDVLVNGSINVLMDGAIKTNSDIAEGKLEVFYGGPKDSYKDCVKSVKPKIKSASKSERFILTSVGYSVCKVYKRELWENLRYPEGYIFEDVITKFILRRKANQVAVFDQVLYGYRRNNASTSHGTNVMKKLDSIWVFPKIIELCKQNNVKMDKTFFMLSLNHLGLLHHVTLGAVDKNIQESAFNEIKRQLNDILTYRPKRLPLVFRVLEKSIINGSFEDWKYVANSIIKYNFLNKYREMN